MYNVYLNYDGCGLEFVGRAKDLFQAQTWADQECPAISQEWEWASHRAAGATLYYPAPEADDAESEWLVGDLPYVAVEAWIDEQLAD